MVQNGADPAISLPALTLWAAGRSGPLVDCSSGPQMHHLMHCCCRSMFAVRTHTIRTLSKLLHTFKRIQSQLEFKLGSYECQSNALTINPLELLHGSRGSISSDTV